MIAENLQLLGYYLGIIAVLGIGWEFVALKVPTFVEQFSKEKLKEIILAFFNSWQFGFLLVFIATNYLGGVIADLVLALGLGIALPDVPPKFKKYWKYVVIIVSLAGILPPWLTGFLQSLGDKKEQKEEKGEKKEEEKGEEEIEWGEPDYVSG